MMSKRLSYNPSMLSFLLNLEIMETELGKMSVRNSLCYFEPVLSHLRPVPLSVDQYYIKILVWGVKLLVLGCESTGQEVRQNYS